MTLFFWALVAFNAGCLALMLAMSSAAVFRKFAGAALNPLVIFAFLAFRIFEEKFVRPRFPLSSIGFESVGFPFACV